MPLKKKSERKKTVLDLFCGCGGMSTGFLQAGFDIVAGVDNWKFAKETYEYNHPGTEFILQDIKEFDGRPWRGKIDVVIGGPPCNFFSKARYKQEPEKGMELVKEFFRIIKEIEPRYWIGENVPDIKKHLPEDMFSKIHNCADYGVPQVRKRCFYGNYHMPKPTHNQSEWITVGDAIGDIVEIFENTRINCTFGKKNKANSPSYDPNGRPSRTITSVPHQMFNLEKTESSQESMIHKLDSPYGVQRRYRNFTLEKPSCTITDMHGDSPIVTQGDGSYRRLSVRECARLQSFSDDFIFKAAKTNNYKMIGKAVPPLFAKVLAEALLENW